MDHPETERRDHGVRPAAARRCHRPGDPGVAPPPAPTSPIVPPASRSQPETVSPGDPPVASPTDQVPVAPTDPVADHRHSGSSTGPTGGSTTRRRPTPPPDPDGGRPPRPGAGWRWSCWWPPWSARCRRRDRGRRRARERRPPTVKEISCGAGPAQRHDQHRVGHRQGAPGRRLHRRHLAGTRAPVALRGRLGVGTQEDQGTGMIITPDGEVVTNNHVIAGATTITVTLYGSLKATAGHADRHRSDQRRGPAPDRRPSNLPTVYLRRLGRRAGGRRGGRHRQRPRALGRHAHGDPGDHLGQGSHRAGQRLDSGTAPRP